MKQEIMWYLHSMFSVQCTYRLQSVCMYKKMDFWVMYGIFRCKIDDIQFCVHVWKCWWLHCIYCQIYKFCISLSKHFVKSKICIWLKMFFLFLWHVLCFWSMAFPLMGFQDHWGFWAEDVISTTNPQLRRSGYLSLPSSSLKTCLVWVAVPSASLLPAWLSSLLVLTSSITQQNVPLTQWRYHDGRLKPLISFEPRFV